MLDALLIVASVFDVATIIVAGARYWRISCGFLAAVLAMVPVYLLATSPAVRWITGFHLFVLILLAGLVWEQKRGKLMNL